MAGLSIEDTDLPVPFGGGKPRLISIEEGVGKMRAAVAARGILDWGIAGRTSAPSMTSVPTDAIVPAPRHTRRQGSETHFLVGIRSRSGCSSTIAAQVKFG